MRPLISIGISLSILLGRPSLLLAQTLENLIEQGNNANSTAEYKQAETIWRQVIHQDPDSALGYRRLGSALYEQKKYDSAEDMYRKAIAIEPEDARTHYLLGNAILRSMRADF